MSAAARYAYLDARVAVFAGRLLSEEELRRLFDEPVAEQAQSLRPTGLLPALEDGAVDAKKLEQAVVSVLVQEALALARPLTGPARDVIGYWMRRFEVSNLKTILRAVVAERSAEQIHAELLDMGPMTSLPVDSLIHAEDTAELLRRLEHTAYAAMAHQARDVYAEQHDLFDVEAGLDREYFTGLAKRAHALPDEAGRDLRRLTGALIDQMNLIWLLRYRHVYGLEPAHAYYLLAPAGRYLNARRLLALVQPDGIEEVLRQLPAPLNALLEGNTTIDGIEAAMRRETERLARYVLAYTTFNLARPCAYLLLKEWQLWRIHSELKGKQLGLDPGLIRAAARITGPNPPAADQDH